MLLQAAVDAQNSRSQAAAAADYSATQAAVDAQYSPSQVTPMFPQEAFRPPLDPTALETQI